MRQLRSCANRWAVVVMLLSVLTYFSHGQDTRIDTTPAAVANPVQGLFDIAFVRDGNGNIVENNFTYALRVTGVTGAGRRYRSADVVMQQCFGGGFLNSYSVLGPAQHTFSSATRWDQPAHNRDNIGGAMPFLDNFTRAWRDFGQTFPQRGMVRLFNGATTGQPPVVQNPYSPGGWRCNAGVCDYAQYESPDNPFGPNDLRLLGHDAAVSRQFVILVAWDEPDLRHQANIIRLWNTLVNTYNVPGGHIAVLYPLPKGVNRIGPFPALGGETGMGDPRGLPAVFVDGSNTFADWSKALAGGFFQDANGQPAAIAPWDRLLIYNTGHGNLQRNVLGLPAIIQGAQAKVRYLIRITYGLDVSLSGDPIEDSSVTDIGIIETGQYSDLMQLTFQTNVVSGTQLLVNDEVIGTFGVDILPASNPIPVGAPSNYVAYQVRVDPAILAMNPDTATIDLLSTNSGIDPSLTGLFNVDFRGGDQELLADQCGQPECAP